MRSVRAVDARERSFRNIVRVEATRGVARRGAQGLARPVAIVGVGGVFVGANLIGALTRLGSGLGFRFSLAWKATRAA